MLFKRGVRSKQVRKINDTQIKYIPCCCHIKPVIKIIIIIIHTNRGKIIKRMKIKPFRFLFFTINLRLTAFGHAFKKKNQKPHCSSFSIVGTFVENLFSALLFLFRIYFVKT